jgi:peptide/nickel transport system substrate-binding protein
MPFAQTIWSGFNSLSSFYSYSMLPHASGNETHWNDKTTTELITKASSATDRATATKYWNQLQKQQYEEGGYLWWANVNNVDASSNRVAGIVPSRYLAMGLPGSLVDAYLAS